MAYVGVLLLFLFLFWLFCVIRNHFFIKKIGALVGTNIELTTKSLGTKQFQITRVEYSPMNDNWEHIWWSIVAEARISFHLVGENPNVHRSWIFTFTNIYSWERNMREMAQMIDECNEILWYN